MAKKDKKKDTDKQEAKKKRQADKATKVAKKVLVQFPDAFPRVLILLVECMR